MDQSQDTRTDKTLYCRLLRVCVCEKDNSGGHDKTSGGMGFPKINASSKLEAG